MRVQRDPNGNEIPGFTPPGNPQLSMTGGLMAHYNAALGTTEFATRGLTALFPPPPPDQNPEKNRIANRLQGFNPKDNPCWTAITQRFGAMVKHAELVSIASVLAANADIRLDRDAKRRKTVLVKWFEENWTAVAPFLDYVVLDDTQKQ